MGTNVVTLPQPSKFFLTGSVPNWKFDGSVVGVEDDGTDLDTLGGDIFFFKFAGDMPFDEGGFADSPITDENDFELSNGFRSLG